MKYTEALDKIQTLELTSTNLDKENQYLKQINNEVINSIIVLYPWNTLFKAICIDIFLNSL